MKLWLIIISMVTLSCVHANIPKTAKVQSQIENLEKALQHIEDNITQQQSQLSRGEQRLAQTDKAINQTSQDIRKTKQNIKKTKKEIQTLTRALEGYEKDQAALNQRLKAYIRGLHQQQFQHPLKWMLQQDRLVDIQKISIWYEYFANKEADVLMDIRNKVTQTQQAQEQLIAQQSHLKQLSQTYAQQVQKLKAERAEQIKLIAELKEKIEDKHSEQQRLQKQHTTLTNLLAELEKASSLEYIDVTENFSNMLGRLPMPIRKQDIAQLALSESYVEAKEGTEVRAIHPGRVVFSEWLRGLGLLLIIDHGQGYMSLYGNNQVLFKSTGDWVNQGEQIALVGKSGGLSKPGLYFEIRKDGNPLKSEKWFRSG